MDTKAMEEAKPPDNVKLHRDREADENVSSLLSGDNNSYKSPVPMDSNIVPIRFGGAVGDGLYAALFTRDSVFKAVSQGDAAQLHGLLTYLQSNSKTLTSPDFIDETNGKTALLKALLNLKDGHNDTIAVLLSIAQKTNNLEAFINAPYTDPCYRGQTALHIAIERRSLDLVRLLVQKGADVTAKADGTFFQHNGLGFYFGELPLSLAACTNQPDVVSFLMENPHSCADPALTDSQGNTVLHSLVVIADNSTETTHMVSEIYDLILVQHGRVRKKSAAKLEDIHNRQGLTPLKLAAKLGKTGMFQHMTNREFLDEETRPLSRKFTECVYGPVHSSLYDTSSIDTNHSNSVLEIVVYGNDVPNRPEMLSIEPLCSLLQDKWERFASKLFLLNFLTYLLYLGIFTTTAFYRKTGTPPFPLENVPSDHLRCVGEIVSVLGAVRFLYKAITVFCRNPPNLRALYTDGIHEILFFLQALLLLTSVVLYFSWRREYVGLLVLSLALAWINLLYYTRGSRQLGIYNVMMQRMIFGDLFHFLFIYSVLLFGFSAAVVTLMDDSPVARVNGTPARGRSFDAETFTCKRPSYNDIGYTTTELFKFTIGMGDLEFTDHVQYKEVFYVLLVCYIILTYILMLNMLIALMGNTVQQISEQSETIWNLQRAFTILDMERSLPKRLKRRLHSKMVCFRTNQGESRRFLRVIETNWKKWRSDLGAKLEDVSVKDAGSHKSDSDSSDSEWNFVKLIQGMRSRRAQQRGVNNVI